MTKSVITTLILVALTAAVGMSCRDYDETTGSGVQVDADMSARQRAYTSLEEDLQGIERRLESMDSAAAASATDDAVWNETVQGLRDDAARLRQELDRINWRTDMAWDEFENRTRAALARIDADLDRATQANP